MRSIRLRSVDLITVAIAAASFATLVAAAGVAKHEMANRLKCANNLKQIGIGIQLYANENRGAFPRTTYKLDTPPTFGTPYAPENKEAVPTQDADPFADEKRAKPAAIASKPKPNDITASVFLLLRTQDLIPKQFVCPSTKFAGFDHGGVGKSAMEWTNFPGREGVARHLSYSYQNPYASPLAISAGFKLNNSIPAEFVVMADMNPGVEALLRATPTDPPAAKAGEDLTDRQRALNSLNHRGDGQNVLFGDGHVTFTTTPFVGIHRDNIYVSGDAASGRKDAKPAFSASPVDANDSILLPTAAEVGQKPEFNETEAGPSGPATKDALGAIADPAAAMKPFLGTYDRDPAGHKMTMTLDEKHLRIAAGPMTINWDYRVLGTRNRETVLELTFPDWPSQEVALWMETGRLVSRSGDAPPDYWVVKPAK